MHHSRLLERTRLNISCAGLLLGICKVVAAQTGPDLAENNSSLAGTATTDTHPAAKAPCNTEGQKAKLHIYLLLGQSNMYGRGALEPQDRTPHPRVLLFTSSNQWISAVEPLHGHGPRAGIGPGLAFGKALVASNTNAAIGLVPCALGASELRRWERGGDLYSNALARATAAMRDGTLAGILWHQGEQDSMTETNSNTYHHRLAKMIGDIRTDLAKPELPFVVGQIGEFLYNRRVQQTPFARLVNDALARIPAQVPHTACVPSTGLTHVGDEVHFDGRSQRELGRRYAEEMLRLQAAKSF